MKRRKILGAAAGAAAGMAAHGLAKQMQRVAVPHAIALAMATANVRDTLSELGYREGINSTIEAVSGENHPSNGCRLWRKAWSSVQLDRSWP